MNTDPLYNPTIPFVHHLGAGSLAPGQLIKLQGSSFPSANCFAINLQTGPSLDHRDDIALHISPVFTSPPRIVRNSLQAHRWGPEESHGGFPLAAGQSFEIIILVEREQFRIAINGYHFTEFRHRLPFHLISYLSVDGEVKINSVTFDGRATSQISGSVPSAPPPPIGANPPPYPTGPAAMPAYPTSGHVNYQSNPQYTPSNPPAYYGAQGTSGYNYSQSGAAGPYPMAGATGQYPMAGTTGQYPMAGATGQYPMAGATGQYPMAGTTSQYAMAAATGQYPMAGATGQYPMTRPNYPAQGYTGPYPAQGMAYPPVSGYPSSNYVQQSHKKSSLPIPISGNVAGIAAGVGAAALGAAMLHGHPFKKVKKLYKHKFKKPKFFKHKFGKFGKWKHKGWSSGSSSSEEE